MNQALKKAILKIEQLPDADQEELAEAMLLMAARKIIDAKLAEAEAQGGGVPHKTLMADLRAKFAGQD